METPAVYTPTAIATSPAKTVSGWLDSMKGQLANALPKHITPERIIRLALTTIRRNPDLLKCSRESLLGAVMQSAQLGLEPGIGNQAFILPYRNRKTGQTEAQFQVGYEGIIDLMYRNPRVVSVISRVAYSNDEFHYSYGSEESVTHIPTTGDRGFPTHVYARVEMAGKAIVFWVMTKADVDKHARQYSQGFNSDYSPWKTNWEAMAMKTAIKQVQRFIPKSIEIREAFDRDDTVRSSIADDYDKIEFELEPAAEEIKQDTKPGKGLNGLAQAVKNNKQKGAKNATEENHSAESEAESSNSTGSKAGSEAIQEEGQQEIEGLTA